MSKKSHRSEKVEIQKGPINLHEQYQYKFMPQPEKTIRDIEENMMRQSGKTLTLHEPKQ